MDKTQLLAYRDVSEEKFNLLQNSVANAVNELKQHGFETLEAAQEELLRLQGEYRVINSLVDIAPEAPAPKKDDKVTKEPKDV